MTNTAASRLLIRPSCEGGEYIRVTPARAGWQHLSFAARRMRRGEVWKGNTQESELGFVILGGSCSITSSRGAWAKLGRRANVFEGMPYALYLPRETNFEINATSAELDLAYGWCRADREYPAQVVTPEQVQIEIRGGDNATRQINSLFPPGFACDRLVAVEVYTPSGNWSSYPPHKHDEHRVDSLGRIMEADLEEIYFYKVKRPAGYAIQRVYTADGRIDELLMARDNNLALVPEGYHPVAAAHGYDIYYLNFLAGSAQSLANSDDPEHAWIKAEWKSQDPRLPLVTLKMEQTVALE